MARNFGIRPPAERTRAPARPGCRPRTQMWNGAVNAPIIITEHRVSTAHRWGMWDFFNPIVKGRLKGRPQGCGAELTSGRRAAGRSCPLSLTACPAPYTGDATRRGVAAFAPACSGPGGGPLARAAQAMPRRIRGPRSS